MGEDITQLTPLLSNLDEFKKDMVMKMMEESISSLFMKQYSQNPNEVKVDFARRKNFTITYTDAANSVDFILDNPQIKTKRIEALNKKEALDKFQNNSDYKTKIVDIAEGDSATDYSTINCYYKMNVVVPIKHIICNVSV